VNRDDLIAYLLHTLPESERDAFEDRWVEDATLYQQLRDAEADLLDAYANGTLSPEDRERVSKYLLDSPVQHRKLLFARTLRDAFPKSARPSIAWRWIASAAAIVLLAGATLWLAWQNAALHRELASVKNTPASSIGNVYVAEVKLDTTRGPVQSIAQVRLPSGSQILRLDLELAPGDEADRLSAILSRDGRAIWNQEPARAERRTFGFVASVWLPVAALSPGEYEIKLSSGGAPVDYYRFRLVVAP
jgi:hypothetical protein